MQCEGGCVDLLWIFILISFYRIPFLCMGWRDNWDLPVGGASNVAEPRSDRNALENILKLNCNLLLIYQLPWQIHKVASGRNGALAYVDRFLQTVQTDPSNVLHDHHSVPLQRSPTPKIPSYLNEQWWSPSSKSSAFSKVLLKAFVSLMTPGMTKKKCRINTFEFVKKISGDKYMSSPQSVVASTFLTNTWKISKVHCNAMMLLFLILDRD